MKCLVCFLVMCQTVLCCADNPDLRYSGNPPPFKTTDLCVVKPFSEHDASSVEISFLWSHRSVGVDGNASTKFGDAWLRGRFKTKATAVRAWTREGIELRSDEFLARVKKHPRAVLVREPFGKRDSDLRYAAYLSSETLLILPERWIARIRDTSPAAIKPQALPEGSRAGTHP